MILISGLYAYLQYSAFGGMLTRTNYYAQIGRSTLKIYVYLCNAHGPIVDMMLYNQGNPVNPLSYEEYHKVMFERLAQSLEDLRVERVALENLLLDSGDQDWAINATSIEARQWKCYTYPNRIVNTSLFECLLKIESAILNLQGIDMNQFTMTNPDVYLVVMNSVNDLQLKIIQAYYFWPEYMKKQVYNNLILQNLQSITYIYYVLNLGLLLLIFYLFRVQLEQHSSLIQHFGSFDLKDCKLLEEKVEFFLSNVIDEGGLDIDDIQNDHYEAIKFKHSKKGNNDDLILKNTGKIKGSLVKVYFKSLFTKVLFLLLFPIYNYYSFSETNKMVAVNYDNLAFIRLMDVLDLATISMREKLKSALFNPEGLFWEKGSYETWIEFRTSGRATTKKVFRTLFVKETVSPGLYTTYQQIFQQNTCDFFEEKRSIFFVNYVGDCNKLLNGSLTAGFDVAYSTFLAMMERYLDDIEYFYKGENPKWNYPEECPLGSNIRLSMMRCLIAQQDFQELEIVLSSYLWVILSELFEQFKIYRESSFQYISTATIIILLVYLICFLCLMGSWWAYSIIKWNKNLETHRDVLGMVDLEILQKNSKLVAEISRQRRLQE